MIVNLYKLIEKKFKQNIEDETTLNLALDVLNQRENLEQENQKYKEVINKLRKVVDKMIDIYPANNREYDYYVSKLDDLLEKVEDK